MSRLRGARSVTSRSPMKISPAVTSSRPAIIRRSVDLPQPEGPTRTRNSPSAISSETSSTAATDAERFVTCSSRISAMEGDGTDQIDGHKTESWRSGIDQQHRTTRRLPRMRLGVEAALVDGLLLPGDVEVVDGRDRRGRARRPRRPRHRRPRLRRPAGERLRRRRLPRRRRRRLPPRRRRAARDRRHRLPPDADHEPGGAGARRDARGADRRVAAAHPRHAPRGAVPLARPARDARGVGAPRSRPRAARPAARRGAGPADDARAGAPRRRRADRPAARARRRRLARAHRRDRRAGERRVRPRRAERHAYLQRDAAVPASRSRASSARRSPATTSSSRSSSTASTSRPRRRRSSGARRRGGSRSSPTRSPRPASPTARTASATSTSTCTRAPCAAPTACSPAAC